MACKHCGSNKHHTKGHPARGFARLDAVKVEAMHNQRMNSAVKHAHKRQDEVLGFMGSKLGKSANKRTGGNRSNLDIVHI